MNVTYNEIVEFIVGSVGCNEAEVKPSTDIVTDLGCWGDDFDEFMVKFMKKFDVNMNSYRWYFHTAEEGQNFGGLFFKPPNKRVEHISVTPTVLLNSANAGQWTINYPNHVLPKRRYDILINMIFSLSVIVLLIYKCSR